MTDRDNKVLYIADQCQKAGMTLAGAAGVLANVEAESAFSSINVQDVFNRSLGVTDEEFVRRVDAGDTALFMTRDLGFGLVQWTAQDRKEKFLAYFKQRGVSVGDFRTQVEYMIRDMKTFYDQRPWIECTTSDNPYQCGYKMCKHYEICANLENSSVYRGHEAEKWYSWLQEHKGESGSAPNTPDLDDEGIPIPKTWPPRTIDFHCSGWPEVWLLQSLLRCRGYNVLDDGIWGSVLTDKVRKFQRENGLEDDGVVGENTYIKLGIDPAIFERR